MKLDISNSVGWTLFGVMGIIAFVIIAYIDMKNRREENAIKAGLHQEVTEHGVIWTK